MKGRKPALVAIEGGKATGKCPAVPSWLSAHAKSEWRRAAPEMYGRNLLAADTVATLESYCVAIGVVREAEEIMTRDGRLIDGEDGPKPHPAFKMQGAAMREVRLLAAELGLTPHRRGMKGEERKSADGWDDLLA